MGSFSYTLGDLLKLSGEGKFEYIAHGCNCQGVYGSGIAKAIKETLPEAIPNTPKEDLYLGKVIVRRTKRGDAVINCYTQQWYGRDPNTVYVDYEAIKSVCREIVRLVGPNTTIGFPLIGAGLANGDWKIVSDILRTELASLNVIIVINNDDALLKVKEAEGYTNNDFLVKDIPTVEKNWSVYHPDAKAF